MAKEHGSQMGKRLCEVLGIDPNLVYNISVEMGINKAAKGHVDFHLTEEMAVGSGVKAPPPVTRYPRLLQPFKMLRL